MIPMVEVATPSPREGLPVRLVATRKSPALARMLVPPLMES